MLKDTNGGRLWAWRIVQTLAGVVLTAVSITTPLVVSAVSNMSDATAALSERMVKIESTTFTADDRLEVWRALDAKADLDYCAKQWLTVTEKLNEIHRAVVRLEVAQETRSGRSNPGG